MHCLGGLDEDEEIPVTPFATNPGKAFHHNYVSSSSPSSNLARFDGRDEESMGLAGSVKLANCSNTFSSPTESPLSSAKKDAMPSGVLPSAGVSRNGAMA